MLETKVDPSFLLIAPFNQFNNNKLFIMKILILTPIKIEYSQVVFNNLEGERKYYIPGSNLIGALLNEILKTLKINRITRLLSNFDKQNIFYNIKRFPMTISKDLGKAILEVRKKLGLSQKDIVNRCRENGAENISQSFLSQVENGDRNPTINNVEIIATKGLGVPLQLLIHMADKKRKNQDLDEIGKMLYDTFDYLKDYYLSLLLEKERKNKLLLMEEERKELLKEQIINTKRLKQEFKDLIKKGAKLNEEDKDIIKGGKTFNASILT